MRIFPLTNDIIHFTFWKNACLKFVFERCSTHLLENSATTGNTIEYFANHIVSKVDLMAPTTTCL